MLRHADHSDVSSIQAVLNAPSNWGKLEAYADEVVHAAIEDERMTVFVWEEDKQWRGFCWLRRTSEGTKIEEFGVSLPGHGVGSRFFAALLERVTRCGFQTPLWLAVAADNAEAIRFYEGFGFIGTEVKKSVWKRRAGPIADALIMTHAPERAASNAPRDQDVT